MKSGMVVGVDIGTDALRAVELAAPGKGGRPVVVRYREMPLPEGAVKSGEVAEINTVAAALKQLWSTGGFRSKNVLLGVGNPKVLVRDLTVPRLSPKEMKQSLASHVQDMLPVPVEDALLDFYPLSEYSTESGPVVQGLLIAAIKESVKSNVAAVQLAGLTPVGVDLIPFALSRVSRHSGGTVAAIDVGARTTNVVVTTAGIPQFVRIMAAGGHNVTAALTDRLQLTVEQAESAKRAFGIGIGSLLPDEVPVADVIRQVTGDLLTSLRNTLSYFINTHPGVTFDAIVLTGGGAYLPGFADALSEVTRIPVTTIDPFAEVDLAKPGRDQPGSSQSRSMSVALGLALGSAA